MEKTAGHDLYSEDIRSFLSGLEREKGKLYALVNALTAGEYYGPNKNGDYFPEQALKKYHPTFVDHGYVYTHHNNKDPKKSLGEILFSTFNDDMKRVELVISLDTTKDKVNKIINELVDGQLPATSMGTRVPYDICSICGHKAKTRKQYCDHLKTQMGEILPDGRRVYANNTIPKFFDISLVTIPADPTSKFMAVFGLDSIKQASAEKTAEINRKAEIKKQIDGKVTNVTEDPKKLLLYTQGELTQDQIEKLSKHPLNEVLSTMLALRVMPKRADFQKLALYSMDKKELANKLEKQGHVFESYPQRYEEIADVNLDNAKEKIANILSDNIEDLALLKPFVIKRAMKKFAQASAQSVGASANVGAGSAVEPDRRSYIKKFLFDAPDDQAERSPVKNPMAPMLTLGALYAGYAKLFGDSSEYGFTRFLKKSP